MFGFQFPPCGSIKIFHIRDDTQNHPAASSWLHGKKQDHKRWRYITVDHSTIDVIDWINQTGRRVVSVLFCMAALASVWSVLRGGRLTSLDASFARCFAFWRTSSKTSTSMFFQKHRRKIASLRKKHDVFHDVLGFGNSIKSNGKSLIIQPKM